MLLHKFEELYAQLRENALSGACTIMILVAADVDALCASRSLTHMLRSDNLAYSLIPVSGYSHVTSILRSLGESNNDIHSIILINCGAIVNLANLLPWNRPDITCYVVDSHRPIHLANIHERERVYVLHDEEEDMDEENLPSDGEGLSGGESSDEEEEKEEDEGAEWDEGAEGKHDQDAEEFEYESEDEVDFGDDTPKRRKKKRDSKKKKRRSSLGSEIDDEEEQSGEEGDDEGEEDEKEEEEGDASDNEMKSRHDAASSSEAEGNQFIRSDGDGNGDDSDDHSSMEGSVSRNPQEEEDREKRRRQRAKPVSDRRERIAQYYLGAYHGAPSALVMHRICQEANRDDRDTLWSAIVGLTDLLVHQRIEHEQYKQMVVALEVEVEADQAQEQVGFETEDGTIVPACEAGRIVVDFEYQFMLYRHWSLYESMYHSPYVASKLLVWWSQGKHRLEELLAKMGFSLSQCWENFKYMDADLKAHLRDELEQHQDAFGLEDVFYLSFYRRMHYGAAVSASDVVYSVSALLEAWQPVGQCGLEGRREGHKEGGGGNADGGAAAAEKLFTARFHEAYDALSGRNEAKLHQGINLAMALQKAIFRVAVSLHDKKAVRNLDHFRWTVIHNNLATAEDYLLTQPMAISRLAMLMIDVSREEKNRQAAASGRAIWKPKPFLIFAERRDTYLVVGVPCPDKRGEVVKHSFGSLLRIAGDGCKARYRHDGFDSAVLELDKESATRFTESLFLAMDAGRSRKKTRGRARYT